MRESKKKVTLGGRTILRDYVRQFRPPKHLSTVCRYETKPGQQAQVDWGEYTYIDEETGEVRKFYLFCHGAWLFQSNICGIHKPM